MKVRPLRISCGRLTGEAPQRQPCSEGWGSGGFAAGVQLFAPPPLRGRHCFPFPLLPLLLTSVTWWPIEHREVKLHDSGGQIYVGTQLLPLFSGTPLLELWTAKTSQRSLKTTWKETLASPCLSWHPLPSYLSTPSPPASPKPPPQLPQHPQSSYPAPSLAAHTPFHSCPTSIPTMAWPWTETLCLCPLNQAFPEILAHWNQGRYKMNAVVLSHRGWLWFLTQ